MFVRVALYQDMDMEEFGPVAAWFEEHGAELDKGFAGLQGEMTLLDRGNSQMIGLGLYNTAAEAQAADVTMDQGPPPGMPEHLVAVLQRATRVHRGVYEVVSSRGRLSVSASAL